jgi:hypothetical protein
MLTVLVPVFFEKIQIFITEKLILNYSFKRANGTKPFFDA